MQQIAYTTWNNILKGRALIGGCLHMDPSKGYKEAKKLLEEYGDPFMV